MLRGLAIGERERHKESDDSRCSGGQALLVDAPTRDAQIHNYLQMQMATGSRRT